MYRSSYISWRAAETFSRLSTVSHRARFARCSISFSIATFCNITFGTRQRGHGHPPRLRILAMRTLFPKHLQSVNTKYKDIVLLWIVCRIHKDSRKESPLDTVSAYKHHSVLISLKKFFIQQIFPLGMKKFSMTMRKQRITGYPVTTSMLRYEVLKVVG